MNLDETISYPAATWDFAVLVGQTVSRLENGYPDEFDAMEWLGYAEDVYDAPDRPKTYRDMIQELIDSGYTFSPAVARAMAG